MSINYYVKTGKKIKEKCNLGHWHEVDEILHVGQSAAGWKFNLHIIPEKGILELDDWIPILRSGKIYDDNEQEISYDDMLYVIEHPVQSKLGPNENRPGCILDDDKLWFPTCNTIGKGKTYCLVSGVFC